MNRRGFLRALGIGAGAVAAAPLLALVPDPRPALAFHPQAFQFIMAPLPAPPFGLFNPAADIAEQYRKGRISLDLNRWAPDA